MILGEERTPTTPQYLDIYAWGTNTALIKDFISTCIEHCMAKDNDTIGIYELHQWGLGWTKAQSKKPRSLSSVVLDEDLSESLIDDIQKFEDSPQWYKAKGVPYRRGYLLYGPPGTGKTSFTLAIAGAMKLNICYLNLSGNNLDDDGLNRALNDAPSKSIILLEDIDGIFVERESVSKSKRGRRVTFSGLLNALDGVRSQEGRILFMTTNHREKLDPALLRPGRCDLQIQLNNSSAM
jgi:chaperone BCS1